MNGTIVKRHVRIPLSDKEVAELGRKLVSVMVRRQEIEQEKGFTASQFDAQLGIVDGEILRVRRLIHDGFIGQETDVLRVEEPTEGVVKYFRQGVLVDTEPLPEAAIEGLREAKKEKSSTVAGLEDL